MLVCPACFAPPGPRPLVHRLAFGCPCGRLEVVREYRALDDPDPAQLVRFSSDRRRGGGGFRAYAEVGPGPAQAYLYVVGLGAADQLGVRRGSVVDLLAAPPGEAEALYLRLADLAAAQAVLES